MSNTECALGVDGNVCSTEKTIDIMKTHLKNTNINVDNLDDEEILNKTKDSLNCNTEECVLKNSKITVLSNKSDIKESLDRIKPSGPANSTALLNNNNIDGIISRLTKIFKDFYHMQFQMIDFAGEKDTYGNWLIKNGQTITPTELGKLDMANDIVKKGYKTFAVVMNTDVRTGGGIHWFSLFCDFRTSPFTLEYFNSSGNKPMRQIQDLLIKTETNLKKAGYNAEVVILSGMVHQRDSETECGPYSLYYIWNRLNDVPALRFQEKRIPDSRMIEFRKKLFK